MTNPYIVRSQVENFLGFTTPVGRESAVDEIIEMCSDEFDRLTGHAWRVTTVRLERHTIPLTNNWVQAQKIYLRNRNVKTLSSAAGDKWMVWNGTSWEDWLTTKIENTDYFIEYALGIVYIRPFIQYPLRTYNLLEAIPMEMTYRFGDNGGDQNDATFDITKVPSDVKRAVIKMTAVNLIETTEWHQQLPEGTDRLKLEQKAERWTKDYEKIIRNRKEVKPSQ